MEFSHCNFIMPQIASLRSSKSSPTTPIDKNGSFRSPKANQPPLTEKRRTPKSNVSSPAQPPARTRSASESEKPQIVNSTFEKTPTNRSLLQVSLLNKAGLSPLATSLSESEDNVSDDGADSRKTKTVKTKCPCKTTSGGRSWYLTCCQCGQVWHSMCANLRGKELTQKGIDSLLPEWQCPWCFASPYPRPKNHKSAKLESSLQTTSYANQISSQVIETLESLVEKKLAALTGPTDQLVVAIQAQLSEMTREISKLKVGAPVPPLPCHPTHPHNFHPPPSGPPPPIARVEPVKVDEINLKHSTKHVEPI